MLRIEQIQDTETLRQVALLLDRENQRLHDRIKKLIEEVSRLKGEDASAAQRQLEFLKELLAQRERALFAEKSERRPVSEGAAPTPESLPRSGHGPRPQPKLPVVEQFHELDEPDRMCPKCGGSMTEIAGQTEDSEEVTTVERSFVIVKHRRKKYRCACNGCIETAPAPPKLSVRSDARGRRYSIDFAVDVAVGKYADHLPLERQVRIMRREGLEIDSQTLWDQIQALARVLRPTEEAVRKRVFDAEQIGADESWWRLMEKKGSKKWWAWTTASEDAVCYTILDSRSQEAARKVLNGYRGLVMADGYGAYDALSREPGGFTLVHCWSHARRKFIDAEPHYPGPCGEILNLIRDLYAVEQECPWPGQDAGKEEKAEALLLRGELRKERSREIVKKIQDWALAQRVLPESSLGKAIAYMLGLWKGLTRFLEDPRVPLDNNATERALRGMVVGRKNHYGSRSKRGTEVAALFYSLIETAKLVGVDPKAYLRKAAYAAIADRNTAVLPHQLLT